MSSHGHGIDEVAVHTTRKNVLAQGSSGEGGKDERGETDKTKRVKPKVEKKHFFLREQHLIVAVGLSMIIHMELR